MLAAIDLVVQNLPGYTLGSVFNEIDYQTLSEMIEARKSGESNDSSGVMTPTGTRVTPGRMGVDPGNQPVMSLAEFAKKF
ncbi:phage tail tape measure protein [Pediococcus acidilactici]|uniref:Phage tail tape measure protein n=1 Tax=Pediococcus acidilactici TaxID=1254 RepID=A0AAW8YMS2_PEDAC|nr:phage tail tape measure protein [Pediococcus acidilactici]MDV2911024.1 phage tail tape measure protein [Pediococcus acidilactici]